LKVEAAAPPDSEIESAWQNLEHFIEASRAKWQDLLERRLDKIKLCALLIDATPFASQQMVVALGISQDNTSTPRRLTLTGLQW
jgi:hypothetical protein